MLQIGRFWLPPPSLYKQSVHFYSSTDRKRLLIDCCLPPLCISAQNFKDANTTPDFLLNVSIRQPPTRKPMDSGFVQQTHFCAPISLCWKPSMWRESICSASVLWLQCTSPSIEKYCAKKLGTIKAPPRAPTIDTHSSRQADAFHKTHYQALRSQLLNYIQMPRSRVAARL